MIDIKKIQQLKKEKVDLSEKLNEKLTSANQIVNECTTELVKLQGEYRLLEQLEAEEKN